MERGSWKPIVEISPSCPRCGSSNTKFCYYNNYSLTQPRYFCKGCRRYWTKGGSLRNVPVGGGCRKNRRSKSLRLSSTHNGLQNKNYGYGGVMTDNQDSIRHNSYNKGINVAPSIEPSCSSVTPDGSHIDLALVYANFLNPQPDNSKNTDSRLEPLELPAGEFDSSLETFPATLEPNNAGLFGCLTGTFDDQVGLNHMEDLQFICYGGLESQLTQNKHQDVMSCHHQQCFDHNDKRNPTGLPLLPGEETWPDSDHIAGLQPSVFGNETDQDPNVLFGNWSPFDFSSTDDDTFSKST